MITLDPPRCQLHNPLAPLSPGQHLRAIAASLRRRLRLRTRLRQWRAPRRTPPPQLGAPSRFAAGSWVRILEPERIFATLDAHKQSRGLLWAWQQWPYCGTVHRVLRPVQRMMDDAYTMRPISGTVLLDSVPCSGPLQRHGCGRDCPMMFRDEWLEAVPPPEAIPEAISGTPPGIPPGALPTEVRPPMMPPAVAPAVPFEGAHATVRSVEAIRRTLGPDHSCGGLLFMPEMYRYAGQRFPVRRKIERVLQGGRYQAVREPLYILEGLHCDGEILGEDGPCQRACRLLWHGEWLELDAG